MTKIKVDNDAITALANLLHDNDLSEIEWKQGDTSIRISRAAPVAAPPVAVAPAAATAAPAPAPAENMAEEDPANHPGAVKSPMVGTAYMAPEPGARPFVSIGDTVSEGQTLMIVEAMKTMNPIPAPRAGKVTHILVENEQPVEFGQPLMIIE